MVEAKKVSVKLSDIKFDSEVYPRSEHSPSKVQEYAENMDAIEAKENYMHVSKDNVLLDGRHRHLAYLKLHDGKADPEITVYRHDVESLKDKATVAVELNNSHGQQLSIKDKHDRTIWFYNNHIIRDEDELARRFSVSTRSVREWLSDAKEQEKEEENKEIFKLYLQAYTYQEIAEKVLEDKDAHKTVINRLHGYDKENNNGEKKHVLGILEKLPKLQKFASEFNDADFEPPIYNVWAWTKKTNEVSHYGNSEQRILENLLYLYTEPFDLVVDPFAGGGSTLDVCMKRLRRCWVSDRKPIVERLDIRKHDIVDGLPFANRWGDVTLTYLDPPYWKQAEGKYSDNANDLANMDLDKFTSTLAGFISHVAEKQKKGVIVLLLSPYQQVGDDEYVFEDLVANMVMALKNNKRLVLENRVSIPYSTQQYRTPQYIEKVKAAKKLAVLTRELIIWRVK